MPVGVEEAQRPWERSQQWPEVSEACPSEPRCVLNMRFPLLRHRNTSARPLGCAGYHVRSVSALPPPNNHRRMLRWRRADSFPGKRLSHAVLFLTPPEHFSDAYRGAIWVAQDSSFALTRRRRRAEIKTGAAKHA
jgi:hypothetical protein